MVNEITIIGPGLIGASLGLAIKKKKIAKRIIGIDTKKSNLSYALKKGSIVLGFDKIDYRINNSDIIFIAFTIVGTAFKFNQKEKNRLLNFSAGGFRDFTRIAASDPTMWRDIFITNKNNILNTLKEFTKDLEAFRKLIEFEDEKEIFNFIKKTKFVRKKIVKLNQP